MIKKFFLFLFLFFSLLNIASGYSQNDFYKNFGTLEQDDNIIINFGSGGLFVDKIKIINNDNNIIKIYDDNFLFYESKNDFELENIFINDLKIESFGTGTTNYFINGKKILINDVVNIKNGNDINNLIFFLLNNEKTSFIFVLFLIWWFAIYLFIKTIFKGFKSGILIYKNKFLG